MLIADLARRGELSKPVKLFLAGFDELTPQQSDLFQALGEYAELETPNYTSNPERWIFRDAMEETRAAAAWARRLLAGGSACPTIGIVVPNLTSVRAKVERIFRETLDPGSITDDQERAFHVSLGPALDRYPAD